MGQKLADAITRVHKVAKKYRYFAALEEASTEHDIVPFAQFVLSEMD